MNATPSLPPLLRLLRKLEFRGKLGLMDRLFGRSLARHGVTWIETRAGIPWELDLTNATHRWIVYGFYEGPAFWHWLLANRARVRTVADSGANIGQTTLYFSRLLPTATIHAYEPGTSARAWLERGVAANRLRNVHVSSSALGAAEGETFLRSCGDEKTHGSWNRIDAGEGERIRITTLDAELARLGIPRLDLWKLDMEGGEPAALKGAGDALRSGRIGAVHAEILGETGTFISPMLQEMGFTPFVPRGDHLAPASGPLRQDSGNALFLHRDSGLIPP